MNDTGGQRRCLLVADYVEFEAVQSMARFGWRLVSRGEAPFSGSAIVCRSIVARVHDAGTPERMVELHFVRSRWLAEDRRLADLEATFWAPRLFSERFTLAMALLEWVAWGFTLAAVLVLPLLLVGGVAGGQRVILVVLVTPALSLAAACHAAYALTRWWIWRVEREPERARARLLRMQDRPAVRAGRILAAAPGLPTAG